MEGKKFSLPTILIVLPLLFASDGLDVAGEFLVAIPILGFFLLAFAKAYSLILWFSLQLWFNIKGVRGNAYLATSIADLLGFPFGQTIGFLITVLITNNPKIAKKANVIAKTTRTSK